MISLSFTLALVATAAASCIPPTNSTTPNCTSFAREASLSKHHATFINATYYPQGGLDVGGTQNNNSFCEVYASVAYGYNDTLIFALWLPDQANYQNRFMAVGNGGYAGSIDYQNMANQLNNGFGMAVAGSDAGHRASENDAGLGSPGVPLPFLQDRNQTKAWLHNSIALFEPVAKTLIRAYYSKTPAYSYFDGCSTGGAQGFALAQHYPDLFDGIYAGSPGNWYSHLVLSFLWNAQHTNTTASSLNLVQLIELSNTIISACDSLDGVKDGVISNPLACDFDINSLACNTTNSTSGCLTAGQLGAVKAIYGGPKRSDNGKQVHPGFSFGSEVGWFLQEGLLSSASAIPILQNLVFRNLSYDADTFNWASDLEVVRHNAGRVLDSISPDLCEFRDKGGKMISTQGWADPLNAATWPIEHLDNMTAYMGGDVSDFYQLFMVPGGGHCGGEPSYPNVPGTYHRVPALVQWVEQGEKPADLLSSGPPSGSNGTRKLCPWPSTANFTGGDSTMYSSYVCS